QPATPDRRPRQQRERVLGPERPAPRVPVQPVRRLPAVHHARGWIGAAADRQELGGRDKCGVVPAPSVIGCFGMENQGDMTTTSRRIGLMAPRRGSALLFAVPVLALSLFLVGCPKRPATTAASAPPPTGSPAPSAAAPSTTPSPSMTPSPVAPPTAGTTTPPAPSEFRATENLKDVFFDFDKYDIRPNDAKTLDANAAWLKSNDNLVLIEGHCDERGTNEYNLALGE